MTDPEREQVESGEKDPRQGTTRSRSDLVLRIRRLALPIAGPLAIVTVVLVGVRDYAFQGLITTVHVDILPFWLPVHCFLGDQLSAGVIPAWNPNVVGGTAFAGNPQSGWGNLSAMLFYGALPCDTAVRFYLILNPLLAGLGAYLFLRSEKTSRVAATTAGLALAAPIAGSPVAITFPFAGSLGWSAMLLACTSRCLHATRWSSRIAWSTAAAVCWGQIAAMHPSFGLVLGTGIVAAYVGFELVAGAIGGRRALVPSLALALLVGTSFVLVNGAVFLPRLALVPRTSIGLTYREMGALGRELPHLRPPAMRAPPAATGSASPRAPATALGSSAAARPAERFSILKRLGWPFLEYPSGAYLGIAVLALSGAGLWSRKHRVVVSALIAFCASCLILGLPSVMDALKGMLPPFADSLYVHHRHRFVYGPLLALPLLAGFGVEAWRQRHSRSVRMIMLVPGIVVWLSPLLLYAPPPPSTATRFILYGLVAGGVALVAAWHRPLLTLLIPLVIGIELTMNGLLGSTLDDGLPLDLRPELKGKQEPPSVVAAEYTVGGPIVDALRSAPNDGRFMSYAPDLLREQKHRFRGYLLFGSEPNWDLMANQRSLLFGLEDSQGHGPVQLMRFWKFMRAMTPVPIKYSTAVFLDPPPQVLDLLQVTAVVGPADKPPAADLRRIVSEGDWAVYEVADPIPRVSLVSSWRRVEDADEALEVVTLPDFDPSDEVILEENPGIRSSPHAHAGTAEFEWRNTQLAEVEVRARRPSIALIRNVYDENWQATVDGEPAPVLAADQLIQGVAVPRGRHTIVLRYVDPSVGTGLTITMVSLLLLAGSATALHLYSKRNPPEAGTAGEKGPLA
jgi:hypothetical protein